MVVLENALVNSRADDGCCIDIIIAPLASLDN